MRDIEKIEARLTEWLARRSARRSIDRLVDSIAEADRILANADGLDAHLARQHIECAERDYRHSVNLFRQEEFDESKQFIERANIHLQVANLHFSAFGETKFQPVFEEDSAAHAIEQLSAAINRTKLEVEYSNCFLTEAIKTGLIEVTRHLSCSIDWLKDGANVEAQLAADAGNLLLYKLTSEIRIENHQLGATSLPTKSKSAKRIKLLIDKTLDCKRSLAELAITPSHQISEHLAGAEGDFLSALQCFSSGDDSGIQSFIEAGMLEIKLAEKMIGTLNPGGTADGSADESEGALVENYKKFRATADRLETALTTGHRTFDVASAVKHLGFAKDYFLQACRAYRSGARSEADRLAHAALLDLDFARQIVFSKERPSYREI